MELEKEWNLKRRETEKENLAGVELSRSGTYQEWNLAGEELSRSETGKGVKLERSEI